MEDEEFEKLEKIEFLIRDGYEIQHEDLEWLVKQLRLQDTMLNLMLPKLTAPIHDEDWVRKYYKEEAKKRLCMK